jgi:hypothetical protein
LDCTTNQRSIPFIHLLHLLVQGHQDPFLVVVEPVKLLPGMVKYLETVDKESSYLKKEMERETGGQEIVQ